MKALSGEMTIASSKLVVHNDSHVIAKPKKPNIRIIHIVAPEIIKTDVQNFRELVQKLTGKQGSTMMMKKKKKAKNVASLMPLPKNLQSTSVPMLQRMKQEIEEIHGEGISSPFLSFLGEVDGYIQDINEFPLLPLRSSQSNLS